MTTAPHQTVTAQRVVTIADVPGLVGQRLGVSRFATVSQKQVNLFAKATGDHQWIHVDPDRARSGPFGTTIAHGYLTLALAPMLLWEILEVTGAAQVINYGIGKARFPAPVPVGSRVRLAADLVGAEEIPGGLQTTLGLTFELKDGPKPACVAEIMFRYYLDAPTR
jgi:acyl dehydratase